MPAPHILLVQPADRTKLSVFLKAVVETTTSGEPWKCLEGEEEGQNLLRMGSVVWKAGLSMPRVRSGDGMKA